MKILAYKYFKIVYCLCFVQFFWPYAKAQDLKNYPFIHTDQNQLHYTNANANFELLCHKLNQLKENSIHQITVVHIGGSHVQGGTWSNTFDTELQKSFNTNGGGYFVFPYQIAHTNGQPYARSFSKGKWKKCWAIGKDICPNLGMNCMSVTNNDSASVFGVALTNKSYCSLFNRIKVYHNFNQSFSFELSNNNIRSVDRIDDEANGFTLFNFSSAIDSVSFKVIRKDTINKDFMLYGFSIENTNANGFYLAGLGMNGASSASFLKCGLFVKQLATLRPDLVIISLGVNDTQSKSFKKDNYIDNYDSLITMIRLASPKTTILLTTTTDNFVKRKTSNKRTIAAKDAMNDLM
ncbi:MAG: GDSL-type esterase/lipase family protein, partial [Bacteroidota bacterium]